MLQARCRIQTHAVISGGCKHVDHEDLTGTGTWIRCPTGIESGAPGPPFRRGDGDGPAAESPAGSHLELPRLAPGRVGAHHQLLVRGDAQGGEAVLPGPGLQKAVLLHHVQQLQHQRHAPGSVHLGDRRGQVRDEEVSHRNLVLLRAEHQHDR